MASPRTTVDLVTALVAGPAVWATGTSLGGAAHGAVAVEAVTVLVVVTFAQGAVLSGGYRPGMAATIVAATAVAGYLVLRPLLLLLRGRTEPGREGLAFAPRAIDIPLIAIDSTPPAMATAAETFRRLGT